MIAKKGQIPLFANNSTLMSFLILIPIPKEISNRITTLKKEFKNKYGAFLSENSVPHITVCSFLLLDYRVSDVFSLLEKRISPLPTFEFRLEDFNTFDNSRVLYVKVNESEAFSFLINEFDRSRQQLMIRKNYTDSPTPHITIAKNLDIETFDTARKEYSEKKFTGIFTVNKLTVLNYNLEERKYDHYKDIKLS